MPSKQESNSNMNWLDVKKYLEDEIVKRDEMTCRHEDWEQELLAKYRDLLTRVNIILDRKEKEEL